MTISELLQIADFFAKIGQFLFGLCGFLLALYAISVKRRDLFRSELAKRQIDELTKIHNDLQSIFFDIYYVRDIQDRLLMMKWSLSDFEKNCPEEYAQYKRYRDTSMALFYKFMSSEYFLLPSWVDRNVVSQFHEAMKPWSPFTVVATARSNDELKTYMNEILKIKEVINAALRKHI